MPKLNKVVIPVAGLGTRGLPFTKEIPKEMLPVIDTPTLHFIVEEVLAAGVEQVIFVTGKGKHALEDYFTPSPHLEAWLKKRGKEELAEKITRIGKMCEVITVRQKEPLGLGHAVACARPVIGDEWFAVCLGDEIFPPWNKTGEAPALKQLVTAAETAKTSVVGVVDIPRTDTQSYGIVDLGGKTFGGQPRQVLRTIEKPKPDAAPSTFAIIGRYVFQPEIFDCLKKVKPGVGGEIQLTDGMDMLASAGKLHAWPVQGCRYDIGNHFSYVKAQIDGALRRPDLHDRVLEYVKSL